MKKVTKKIVSFILALTMALTLMPAVGMTVKAEGASYSYTSSTSEGVTTYSIGMDVPTRVKPFDQYDQDNMTKVDVVTVQGEGLPTFYRLWARVKKDSDTTYYTISAADRTWVEAFYGSFFLKDTDYAYLFYTEDTLDAGSKLCLNGFDSVEKVTYKNGANESGYDAFLVPVGKVDSEGYLLDASGKRTPVADDFYFDSTTGELTAASETNLGTVTPYYKKQDDTSATWSATSPTDPGTYDVGVVTTGSTTYNAIGSEGDPYQFDWTYEVSDGLTHVESIWFDATSLTLTTDSEYTLELSTYPSEPNDSSVTWSSTDENIVTVDENGKITAVAAGTATVTATANDNCKKPEPATCTVTVVESFEISTKKELDSLFSNGGKGKLTADIDMTQDFNPDYYLDYIDIASGKTVELDLNGYALINASITVNSGAKFIINDNSEAKTGSLKFDDAHVDIEYATAINNKGTLEINGGAIEGGNKAYCAITNGDWSDSSLEAIATISNSKITGFTYCGIKNNKGCKSEVKGKTVISNNQYGIYNYGSAIIKGNVSVQDNQYGIYTSTSYDPSSNTSIKSTTVIEESASITKNVIGINNCSALSIDGDVVIAENTTGITNNGGTDVELLIGGNTSINSNGTGISNCGPLTIRGNVIVTSNTSAGVSSPSGTVTLKGASQIIENGTEEKCNLSLVSPSSMSLDQPVVVDDSFMGKVGISYTAGKTFASNVTMDKDAVSDHFVSDTDSCYIAYDSTEKTLSFNSRLNDAGQPSADNDYTVKIVDAGLDKTSGYPKYQWYGFETKDNSDLQSTNGYIMGSTIQAIKFDVPDGTAYVTFECSETVLYNGNSSTYGYLNRNGNTYSVSPSNSSYYDIYIFAENSFTITNVKLVMKKAITGATTKALPSSVSDDKYMCTLTFADGSTIDSNIVTKGSAQQEYYNVWTYQTDNGKFTVGTSSVGMAEEGETVTVNPVPNSKYEVDTVMYYFNDGTPNTVTYNEKTGYTFTMPAQDVTVVVTFKKMVTYDDIEPTTGKITNITNSSEVSATENPLTVQIKNDDKLESLLGISAADVAAGVNVWLVAKDATATVSDTDKTKVDAAKSDYTVGTYLDLSLLKKVGTGDATAVSDLNGKLQVSISVPDSLRKDGRTYEIIRIHNGEASVIPGSYDSKTGTFTFETDGFSTYALAYKDGESELAAYLEYLSNLNLWKKLTGANADQTAVAAAVTSPKTGESTNWALWIAIVMIAATAGAGCTAVYRRRRED